MKLYFEEKIREETILEVANKMMIAARTAPKGKGVDNLVIALVKKEGIKEISDKLKEMAQRENVPAFFQRDAEKYPPGLGDGSHRHQDKPHESLSLWDVWI